MRDDAGLPELLSRGQPCTWRTHLIKVAAVVVQSTRRIIVRLASQWPWWPIYRAAGKRALAFPPPPDPTATRLSHQGERGRFAPRSPPYARK